ncbi:hypothetical protein DK37_15160 [Halomonas sp. SUBG004]|nr:hypothetical protein DK37_15160 [Halomonas sp. SUBG004]
MREEKALICRRRLRRIASAWAASASPAKALWERDVTVDCRMAGSKTSGTYIEQSDWIMINATNE